MATTKIWKIKGNMYAAIPKVIDYAKNPEKTTTEKGLLTSALNCDIRTADRDFIYTKHHFGKTDQILAWHGYQSFKHNEVTPELAHQIGVLTAQELWGDRFQVVIATHLDKGHIHNHFVVNSVSCVDGLKFYASEKTYRHMRHVSDRLCKEFNLSYIPNPKKGNTKNYGEWNAEQMGQPTKRSLIRKDIDAALAKSLSWKEFLCNLSAMNYEINTNGKYAKLRPKGSSRFFRFDKLGEGYTEASIKERIRSSGTYVPKTSYPKRMKYNGSFQYKKKVSEFKALYLYYCYQMGVLKKRPHRTYVTPEMREDIKEIEKITEDYLFLKEHKITDTQELKTYKEQSTKKYSSLSIIRQRLENQYKTFPNNGALKAQLEATKKEMTEQAKRVKMCIRVENRTKLMQENLKEQRKEKNNERRVRSSRNCSELSPESIH